MLKRWLSTFLLLVMLSSTQTQRLNAKDRVLSPIRDGDFATQDEIYSTVALVKSEDLTLRCSGTLISPTVVITAAHCLVDTVWVENTENGEISEVSFKHKPDDLYVMANELNIDNASMDSFYSIQSLNYPSDFPTSPAPDQCLLGPEKDIGILILNRPVTSLTPARIPTPEEIEPLMKEKNLFVINGYGRRTDFEKPRSGILAIGKSPLIHRGALGFVVGTVETPGAYPGDSGGPAYLEKDGTLLLVGAASSILNPRLEDCPAGSIYTFLPAYIDWIEKNSQE